ncbi:unnamed protein product [Bursaphelenchus xylophilus]|uniref:(pine wood nematode) hypothetical protein n=1 Tax=Bursaphelenchus xylophilus TaxID=6326 RepID=A0A811KWR2_BURXY|nr:unnamed protein product [Bursaphelenchus xylophilus]CAG9105109.1 unnamed protein product [Bursaphelenchus xylophilus]
MQHDLIRRANTCGQPLCGRPAFPASTVICGQPAPDCEGNSVELSDSTEPGVIHDVSARWNLWRERDVPCVNCFPGFFPRCSRMFDGEIPKRSA